MNINQFLSKVESSDAYKKNEAVRKLVSEHRQALVELGHGNDREAFMTEFVKFNDQLDLALNPTAAGPVTPKGSENVESVTEIYTVEVDYDLPLAEAIAAGKYDYVNGDITAVNFPSAKEGKKTVEVILVGFNKEMTIAEVLAELDRRGFRPATLPELCALGATHPDLQRKSWIVALGSSWRNQDGNVRVPILRRDVSKRSLALNWDAPDDRWVPDYRFAAVRK